jgi:hypothetical protein
MAGVNNISIMGIFIKAYFTKDCLMEMDFTNGKIKYFMKESSFMVSDME